MVCCHQQVAGIGISQFLDEPYQFLKGFLGSGEYSVFRVSGIAGFVDQVVIDINHIIVAHQSA